MLMQIAAAVEVTDAPLPPALLGSDSGRSASSKMASAEMAGIDGPQSERAVEVASPGANEASRGAGEASPGAGEASRGIVTASDADDVPPSPFVPPSQN